MTGRLSTGTIFIIIGLAVSGCGWSPGSLDPFGREVSKEETSSTTAPLVMPGELEETRSSSSKTNLVEDKSESESDEEATIDFTEAKTNDADAARVREQRQQRDAGETQTIIEPSIGTSESKRAAELADQGHQAYRKGNLNLAIKKYSQAIRLDPENPEYLTNLGSLYFNKNDYEEADKYYSKALSLKPRDAELNYFMGAVQIRLKNRQQARNYLKKALDLRPDYQAARNLLDQLS